MLRLVALLFCALLAGASARAEKPFERTVLANGLEVVLAPDRRAPKIVLQLLYRVGALDEPPGRSGFAHLFEHLTFTGTEARPSIDEVYAAAGIDLNGYTFEDRTLYYAEGLSTTLPLILSVEADRMANLGRAVDQRDLDLQRAIVKNELRQNVIDTPEAAGWEAMWGAFFPRGHPYSRSVLGSIADLDAAGLADVHGFFDTWYVPNNAILVLVGDFVPEDARNLIDRTFGLVPRGPATPRPSPGPQPPTRARIDVEDRVPAALVAMGFSGPAAGDDANGALAIAAELLGNADYGFLHERLVDGAGLATSAGAEWTPGLLAGRFAVDATAAEGVAPADLERALRQALIDFRSRPVDPAELERARRSLLLGARLSREAFRERAEAIAVAADLFGDPGRAFADDPRLKRATAADVEAAMKALPGPEDAVVLVVRPGARGGFPAVLTESTGEGKPFAVAPRLPVDVPAFAARSLVEPRLPAAAESALSNGIRVVHYRIDGAPMAHVAAVAAGGWTSAPAGKEGLMEMAAALALRGAGARGQAEFARAAADIGASIGSAGGQMATAIMLSVPPDALAAGIDLFADAVLAPRLEPEEWTRLATQTLDQLARREGELPGVASRAARRALTPPRPGLPDFDWSAGALRAIAPEDIRAAHGALFRPSATTFLSVGPGSAGEVAAALERRFGDWQGGPPALASVPPAPLAFPDRQRVILVPEPGAAQSALHVARAAPGLEEPARDEAEAVARLLGQDFLSRLNTVIREEKGYSYRVDGSVLGDLRAGSALEIATTVERDNTGAALADILAGFAGLAGDPVSQAELDRTTTAFRTALAATAETAGGLFSDMVAAAGAGYPLDEVLAARRRMTGLKLAQVRAAAAAMAPLDGAVIVVAGDPDAVLPQLRAIGIGGIEIADRPAPGPDARE